MGAARVKLYVAVGCAPGKRKADAGCVAINPHRGPQDSRTPALPEGNGCGIKTPTSVRLHERRYFGLSKPFHAYSTPLLPSHRR